MMNTLRIDRVEYHRNGVGGEGFHLVQFRYRGSRYRPLLATVFEGPGRVAVIDPVIHGNRWRCETFEAELREAIAKADADGSSFVHAEHQEATT